MSCLGVSSQMRREDLRVSGCGGCRSSALVDDLQVLGQRHRPRRTADVHALYTSRRAAESRSRHGVLGGIQMKPWESRLSRRSVSRGSGSRTLGRTSGAQGNAREFVRLGGMSITIRVIPCLDVSEGRGIEDELRRPGATQATPSNWPAATTREGADELTFLDITATSRQPAPAPTT